MSELMTRVAWRHEAVRTEEPAAGEDEPNRMQSTAAVGYWSAVLATVFSTTYVLAQIGEWLGMLGSAGGPESSSTPLGIYVLLTPSLLLGPSFLALIAAVHQLSPIERKVWSSMAFGFATIYAALICINYYVQLAWVGPRLASGRVDGMEAFLFVPFDSFLYAVDILGYSFMSLATFCAAWVFEGHGLERRIRWLLIANGLVLPFLVFQMYVHALIWIASIWAVTFPGSTLALAIYFRRLRAGSARPASARKRIASESGVALQDEKPIAD
jgi:hypothetical protein